MENKLTQYGIEGFTAPELLVPLWIDDQGHQIPPVKLANFSDKFVVIYCFQSWCRGCHSHGLPALQDVVEEFRFSQEVKFLAVQTVFEGWQQNTYQKIRKIQVQYNLPIPFGHDQGNDQTKNISSTMINYRTGGTPWFIFIDRQRKVVYNGFHIDAKEAIVFIQNIISTDH